MRVLKFAKVDFIKTNSFRWLLLFPVIGIIMVLFSDNEMSFVAYGYCLFAGIISCTIPFNFDNPAENGFLQMLPAKPGDTIRGHFSYGFIVLCVAAVLGILTVWVSSLFKPEISLTEMMGLPAWGIYPLAFALALLIAGVQSLMLSIFRTQSVYAMQILRMAPGFIFFFGVNALLGEGSFIELLMKLITIRNCWISLAVSIVVYALLAQVGARLAVGKE